jgi:N-acetylglucosaminyl-diphospho-decaprenol L-rhamnosyltransferase
LSSNAPISPGTLTKAVDLSILIVSWNVWDLLRSCLRTIERASRPISGRDHLRAFGPVDRAPTLEVIVVDNASDDATADLVAALFPWVRLVESSTNLGFSGGNNLGYAATQGRYLFFLNPDTEIVAQPEIHDDTLWTLYRLAEANPDIAILGPRLRYGDGATQSSRRRFPTPFSGFWESTWLGRAWPNNPWARRLYMADWPAQIGHDVDWLVGAALFARRSALDAIRLPEYLGPFDEGFFMYSEELDLCRRLKAVGGRIHYTPEALVIHYEGRSSNQVAARRDILFHSSKIRYYQKYFHPRWANWLRRYLLLEHRYQLWLEQFKSWLGHKRELRRRRIDAYRQLLASGLRTSLDQDPWT